MVKQGDIVKISLDPAAGHEQAGYRPAIVISNDLFNKMHKLTIVCPITRTDRTHPFHVRLDERTQTEGVILCDQIRVLDLLARDAKIIESAPGDILSEVTDIIKGFL